MKGLLPAPSAECASAALAGFYMACGKLTGTVLTAEKLHQGQNDPIGLIQMALCATFGALDPFAFLPQMVRGVGFVCLAIGFVNAAAVDEGGEDAFIGPFVRREAAFAAFEVACCFLVCMLISCCWMLHLDGQDLCNNAGPGCLFPNSSVSREVWLGSFMF